VNSGRTAWTVAQAPQRGYRAVLFDLDGVLTPTADVHMAAWKRLFTDYFTAHGVTPPYTDDDYFASIDGKPRYDGVRTCLASRGITLDEGQPDDATTSQTVCGLGNRKNELFTAVLRQDGVVAYPGSVALLDHLKSAHVAVAVVSSSRNAAMVLEAAGLSDRFDVVVSGVEAAQQHLRGKPAPDTYAYAAQLLGVPVDEAVVVEDAISGVAAGAAGSFGLVIGVDRGAGEADLRRHGADVVVSDLQELVQG